MGVNNDGKDELIALGRSGGELRSQLEVLYVCVELSDRCTAGLEVTRDAVDLTLTQSSQFGQSVGHACDSRRAWRKMIWFLQDA